MWKSWFHGILLKTHSVEITGILSHSFLAKISWKQRKIKGLNIFTIKHIFLNCKLWFFAQIRAKMAIVKVEKYKIPYQTELDSA